MRFCGDGRKWCGKVCIDARHSCNKGKAAVTKSSFAKKRAVNVRNAGFKKMNPQGKNIL